MGILRVLVLLNLAAFLAACAAHVPVFETQDNVLPKLETQDNVTKTTAQRTPTAKITSEAKKPKPSAPKPTATATASANPQDTINPITPKVGSPQKWEKERAEDERKEQYLKQVIESICRGC